MKVKERKIQMKLTKDHLFIRIRSKKSILHKMRANKKTRKRLNKRMLRKIQRRRSRRNESNEYLKPKRGGMLRQRKERRKR